MDNSTLKKIAVAILGSVVLIAVLYGVFRIIAKPEPVQTYEMNLTEKENAKGNPDSKVVLVEYSDFQCPACAAYHPIVTNAIAQLGDNIYFVYRHFPLPAHPHAKLAASAAEAAGAQNKFFEMHDLLFENQEKWGGMDDPTETFVSYAKELKLDEAKFKADMASSTVSEKIESDQNSGVKNQVNATPTFFLNGQKLDSPPTTVEAFVKLLQEASPQESSENNNLEEDTATNSAATVVPVTETQYP